MIKLEQSYEKYSDSDAVIVYVILDNDESMGSIELHETDDPELLVIGYIDIPESLKSRTREILRTLKRLYPKVTRLRGLRTTGSYSYKEKVREVKI